MSARVLSIRYPMCGTSVALSQLVVGTPQQGMVMRELAMLLTATSMPS